MYQADAWKSHQNKKFVYQKSVSKWVLDLKIEEEGHVNRSKQSKELPEQRDIILFFTDFYYYFLLLSVSACANEIWFVYVYRVITYKVECHVFLIDCFPSNDRE